MYGFPLLLAYLLAVGLVAFLIRDELGQVFRNAGRPLAYLATSLITLTLLAQAWDLGSALYPAVSWTMYSDPAPSPVTWDLTLIGPEGQLHRPRPRLAGASVRPLLARGRAELRPVLRAREDDPPMGEGEMNSRGADEVVRALVALDAHRTGLDLRGWYGELRRCRIPPVPDRRRTGSWCEEVPVIRVRIRD